MSQKLVSWLELDFILVHLKGKASQTSITPHLVSFLITAPLDEAGHLSPSGIPQKVAGFPSPSLGHHRGCSPCRFPKPADFHKVCGAGELP